MIEVELPDGTIAEFPEGTSNDVIKGALQKRFATPTPDAKPKVDFAGGMAGSGALGAADTLSFGLGDEIGAGIGAASEYIASKLTGDTPRSYDEILGKIRDQETRAKEANPKSFLAGQVAGAVTGGVGLAKGGASLAANAASRGSSLARVAAASAGDGAIIGGAQGFGTGEGTEGRIKGALTSAAMGLGTGLVAPLAAAGIQKGIGMAAAPVAARIFPQRYADRALEEGIKRSGFTVDDIANSLSRAQADDQAMFTVADAMGNSGQRMLSTVARTPNNERQAVIEALQNRQIGQGDRLSSFMADGFEAPDTAAQRVGSLTAERTAAANANYGAARDGAGSVDPSRAIQAADEFLGVKGSLPKTAIADDSIESAVNRARGYLTDGESVVSDFNTALRSKQEIDAMIEGASPSVQRQLIPIRNALDDALEAASPSYANARNTFRQQSKAIDAVDRGRAAASGRARSDDTVPVFNAMSPEEQAAFRAGYVDPYIARIESMSASPTTNKARALITPKTGDEFPAFAAPTKADQLGRRIAREQRMFETSNAALGGSKTADNLADAAELNRFDPGIMSSMMRGDVVGALMAGGRSLMNNASGATPRVVEQVAKALMETNPQLARELLQKSAGRLSASDLARSKVVSALVNAGSAGLARLGSP